MEGKNDSKTNKKCSSKTRHGFYYQNQQYQTYPALLPPPFPLPPTTSLQLTTAIPPLIPQSHTYGSKTHLQDPWRQKPRRATPSETHVLVFPATKAPEGLRRITSSPNRVDNKVMAAVPLDRCQKPASNSQALVTTRRPDSGGTDGLLIPLLANHFLVRFDPSQQIFHYDVEISPHPSKEIARIIKRKLVEDNPDVFLGALPAFDGRRNLYSPVKFQDDKLELFVSLPIPTVKSMLVGDSGIPQKQTHKLFRVNIKLASKLDGQDLSNYLSKEEESVPLPQDYLHALDVVLRESPSEKCIPV